MISLGITRVSGKASLMVCRPLQQSSLLRVSFQTSRSASRVAEDLWLVVPIALIVNDFPPRIKLLLGLLGCFCWLLRSSSPKHDFWRTIAAVTYCTPLWSRRSERSSSISSNFLRHSKPSDMSLEAVADPNFLIEESKMLAIHPGSKRCQCCGEFCSFLHRRRIDLISSRTSLRDRFGADEAIMLQ